MAVLWPSFYLRLPSRWCGCCQAPPCRSALISPSGLNADHSLAFSPSKVRAIQRFHLLPVLHASLYTSLAIAHRAQRMGKNNTIKKGKQKVPTPGVPASAPPPPSPPPPPEVSSPPAAYHIQYPSTTVDTIEEQEEFGLLGDYLSLSCKAVGSSRC